jgi:hypothetical protein
MLSDRLTAVWGPVWSLGIPQQVGSGKYGFVKDSMRDPAGTVVGSCCVIDKVDSCATNSEN